MNFDPEKVDTWSSFEYSGDPNGYMCRGTSGEFVLTSDYNQLLALYSEIGKSLHLYQVTVERAIAEGHDVTWLRDEVKRQQS